jgi:hypothetical protein
MWSNAMVVTIGIGALIGAALGLRFNAFILVPTIILAGLGIAVIQIARGDEARFVAFTIVMVTTVLQISYLLGSATRAAVEGLVPRNLALDIQEHMEVVGSDGQYVGKVDHTEAAELVLTGDDPKAGGSPHLISVDWVDYVDSKVHLNRPSKIASH